MKKSPPKTTELCEPAKTSDGACSACVAGACRCEFHANRDAEREAAFSAVLQRCAASVRSYAIAATCARFELESDEFLTREEKAAGIITI
jgi:hypothetical protein